MSYTLIALIENDRRELPLRTLWDAMVASYMMIKESAGWPVEIKFRGVKLAGDEELNDFFGRYGDIITGRVSKKQTAALFALREATLREARARLLPEVSP